MKKYTTTADQCWDMVAYVLTGDEFNMDRLLEHQYDEALTYYCIIPKGTSIVVPDDILNDSETNTTPFKAPWA